MITIGIVANEPSGDVLGAALISALHAHDPTVQFIGVAGPHMLALGCKTLLPMEQLSVMGLIEVVRELPRLLRARRQLTQHFLSHPPSVFIGIDAPDFNLALERRLRHAGIPTVHVVCPTVWAWRRGRIKTLRQSVDLLLSLFPFEEPLLQQYQVPAHYIGHPLADAIPIEIDQMPARHALQQSLSAPLVALLPGSRMSEMQRLAEPFIHTAWQCYQQRPALRFITPLVSPRLRVYFAAELNRLAPQLPITLIDGRSREVMAAADIVLTASGTATLEALLLKRPMVVGYRLHPLTWWFITQFKLVSVPYAAMANLLVGRELAPEFLQTRCTSHHLAPALLQLLDDQHRRAHIAAIYLQTHLTMRRNAAQQAALAIQALMKNCTPTEL